MEPKFIGGEISVTISGADRAELRKQLAHFKRYRRFMVRNVMLSCAAFGSFVSDAVSLTLRAEWIGLAVIAAAVLMFLYVESCCAGLRSGLLDGRALLDTGWA